MNDQKEILLPPHPARVFEDSVESMIGALELESRNFTTPIDGEVLRVLINNHLFRMGRATKPKVNSEPASDSNPLHRIGYGRGDDDA